MEIQKLIKNINFLVDAKTKLQQQELSPIGAWIHEYTVVKIYPSGFVGEYKYAKWQANKPIFKVFINYKKIEDKISIRSISRGSP